MEKIITAKDIAQALNLSVGTVYQCMKKNQNGGRKTVEAVRKYAESVGYDPRKAMGYHKGVKNPYEHMIGCRGGRAIFINSSPFNTYENYVEYVKKLREEGWTNQEIAMHCGCTTHMIRHAIGTQPKEYTALSHQEAGKRRAELKRLRKERAEAVRKAEERKRLQANLDMLQKEKETVLANITDMQERYRSLWAQKYSNYKELLNQIEIIEKQIEGVA